MVYKEGVRVFGRWLNNIVSKLIEQLHIGRLNQVLFSRSRAVEMTPTVEQRRGPAAVRLPRAQ